MIVLKGRTDITTAMHHGRDLFSHARPDHTADRSDPADRAGVSRENLFSETVDPHPVSAASAPPPRDPFAG